jgi:hypothetical protein
MAFELYKSVPKDWDANLKYRLALRKKAENDKEIQAKLSVACKHDVLFWMNAFCWLYEPRPRKVNGKKMPNVIPFITWEHQDPVILECKEHLGFEDLGVEKARGEGMSWIALYLAVHDWLFDPMCSIGLVSRNELAVDNPDDSDSLMWKSLACETPVLRPDGSFTPIGDLVAGDYVVGSDGRPTRVMKSLPQYESEMVKVAFSDGCSITCTPDHLWPVSSVVKRMGGSRHRTYDQYENKTAEEIGSSVRRGGSFSKHLNWQLKRTPSIKLPVASQPIPAYVLGVLIGDGSLSKTGVSFASVDKEIVSRVCCELGGDFKATPGGKCSWFVSSVSKVGNAVSRDLVTLGLKGKRAWEKRIPDLYMRGSEFQRLELLRGLMDTDGTCHKGGYAYYSTTSSGLADDVAALVRSLGGIATVKSYKKKYRYKGEMRDARDEYRVGVMIPGEAPFHLTKKVDRHKRSQTLCRRIVSVEPAGRGFAKCISVEAADGLFVVSNYLLTHNCDWALTKLPSWMQPKKKRSTSEHTLKNLDNGAMITGYSATGDVASGGRKKWFLMDELAKFPRGPDAEAMASTQHVTNSRLIVSTPKGAEGEYHRIMHEPSSMVKLVLDWKDNPSRNRGLYRFNSKGVPEAVDPVNNPLLAEFNSGRGILNYEKPNPLLLDLFSRLRRKGFKLEGTLRSPWFDHECDRPGATPMNIAQELGRDYGGSMSRIYGHDFFAAAEKTVRPAYIRGILNFNTETLEPEFEPSEDGNYHLWTQLDHKRRPPRHVYSVGCDICTGLGGNYTSNSVIEVVDLVTMEQVFEYATNHEPPKDFADIAIAVAKFFYDAYLSWEANGPGGGFTQQVKTRQYGNIYYRKSLHKTGNVKTKEMGWWTDARTKEMMFGYLGSQVRSQEFSIRSDLLSKECGQYVYVNGQIDHVLNAGADDSAKGKAHGDRVIAMGVALMAAKDRPLASAGLTKELTKGEPPPGTMAARQKEYEASLEDDEEEWNDSQTSDFAARRKGRLSAG